MNINEIGLFILILAGLLGYGIVLIAHGKKIHARKPFSKLGLILSWLIALLCFYAAALALQKLIHELGAETIRISQLLGCSTMLAIVGYVNVIAVAFKERH